MVFLHYVLLLCFINVYNSFTLINKKYFPNFLDIKYIDYTNYEWENSANGWTRPNINLIDFI